MGLVCKEGEGEGDMCYRAMMNSLGNNELPKKENILFKHNHLKLLFEFVIITIKALLSSLYEYGSYDCSALAPRECKAFFGAGPFTGKPTMRGVS